MKEQPRKNSPAQELGRRQFLSGVTAGVAGWTVVKAETVRGSQANSSIQLGVIGCGGRGRFVGKLFEEHSRTKVVSLHDYFQDQADDLGEALQVPRGRRHVGLNGYRDLLQDELDAVAIMSPPYFHPEQTVEALEAGHHVYLSKPIAVDVPGCQRILEACRKVKGKKSILVDFQTRADPFFRQAAERVHQGAIGSPVLGHVYYQAGRLRRKAEGESPVARLRNWVFDKALSGDIIVEQNIHVLDVANWYLGGHPLKAQGTGGRRARVDVGDCWDHFVVTFWYPGDILVDFSSGQYLKGYEDLCIRVYGSEGTVDSHYGGEVRISGDRPWAGGSTEGLYSSGTITNIQAFEASLQQSRPLFDTVEASAESNLTSILGRMAAYQGHAVTWEEMLRSSHSLDADLQLPADGHSRTS